MSVVPTAADTQAAKDGVIQLSNSSPQRFEPTEYEFANVLQSELPPIKTVAHDWFAYGEGAWNKIDRATLRPKAQAVLPEHLRTARAEAELLNHLEGRLQVPFDSFKGFYMFQDGRVLINAANGIIAVSPDGLPEMLPHSPRYQFTLRTAATYTPGLRPKLFERILAEALPDEEDRHLFKVCCGNFIYPDCRHEAALVCYGEAGSGKSTMAAPITDALGPGLAEMLSMSQICDPKSYHLHRLRFAAVNLGTELDAMAVDESGNFKCIVSGESLMVRPIFSTPFVMQTACKLWFLANGLPRFKNGTAAELRRTRFLRFNCKPAKKDVTLKQRLLLERDAVLTFMVEGLQMLLRADEIPLGGAESRGVHDRFKISNDPVGTFVAERCTLDPQAYESKDALGEAFESYAQASGLLEWQKREWFFRTLYERFTGVKARRVREGTSRIQSVAGIKLNGGDHE